MGAAAGRGRMGALDRAKRDAEIQRRLCDRLSEGRGGGGVALATRLKESAAFAFPCLS